MIELHKLNSSVIYINPHQIEYIELTPDTMLVMLSGKRIMVKESYQELFDKIVAYRSLIGAFKNEE
ncbi:MAG: flagellar FlbD family protein [Spirochaetales bacterium]|nr:flagellar FlbD family protein [Spirochaetales bacterium]